MHYGSQDRAEKLCVQCMLVGHLGDEVGGGGGGVSKETVVLLWWGNSIQKFGFINGIDNVNWPPYRDSKS